MEPIKGENREEPVLVQVVKERNQQIQLYEGLIAYEDSFLIALVNYSDEIILGLYDYLVREEKKLRFMLDDQVSDQRYDRIGAMLLRLEDLEVVQKHMMGDKEPEETIQETPEEKEAQINDILDKLAYRKKGPIGKAVHRLAKKVQNIRRTK
ncbi:MAG: hypothetical protein IKP07_02565 [Bacilli bacterium]|nr:hypothetical protein [Bacilli bacterium]